MTPPSLDATLRLIRAQRIGQTLAAARQLGLPARLEASPATIEELAELARIEPPRLRRLLDGLEAMELVSRVGGRYTLRVPAVVIDQMLAPRDLVPALRGQFEFAGHTPEGANRAYPAFVDALSQLMSEAADTAGRVLAAPGAHILEVAAGACGWSIGVARHSPGCRLTINDLPAVLERGKAAVARAGLSDRATFLPGDLNIVELEACHDLVLVPMVLHLFDPEAARAFTLAAAQGLAPGGRLVLIDVFVDGRQLDLDAQVYSLELLTRSRDGRVHRLDDALGWLGDAGLHNGRVEYIDHTVKVGLVMAERPALGPGVVPREGGAARR